MTNLVRSTDTRTAPASPFLKWAGGKARLLREVGRVLPTGFQRYIEPFVGGGAPFFHIRPRLAVLGDANWELMETYRVVRDDVARLMAELDTHVWNADYYYELRASDPSSLPPLKVASRFIFLNKTCYNG